MRWMPSILLGLTFFLLTIAGCKTTPDLKPAAQEEVLATPPANDPRYCNDPSYPSETLTQNKLNRNGPSSLTPTDLKSRPAGAMPGSFSMGQP
jgi:hypothetical protein